MPTVVRQDGFSVMIYLKDHAPPHVHVFGQGEIVVNLGDDETPVSVRDNFGMSSRDERRALKLVGANQELLLEIWRGIYG